MSSEASETLPNPYAAPQAELSSPMAIEQRGPEGIGGWLLLPLLGLIFTPIRCSLYLAIKNIPIFTEGHFSQLTDPNFAGYHSLWAPLLIMELVGNALIGVLAIWGLVLMFRKAKAFPRFMIIFYTAGLVFVTIDTMMGLQIPYLAEEGRRVFVKQMIQAAIPAAIWIPYMLVSKRVRNTFVN
ncbi:MAG: DUF2569 domain-containing protein [Pirellulales bacterium]